MNKTNIFIIASTLALVALVLFQISWYKHSHGLLEQQFDSTVNMAMCLAIQNIDKNTGASCSSGSTAMAIDTGNIFTDVIEENVDLVELDTALGNALAFYNIDLDYEFHILKKDQTNSCSTGYCCDLSPFTNTKKESLQVFFPNKTPYLRNKMKFQLGACLLIILFISSVFLLANYLLRQQKRIAQSNIDFFNNMTHEFNTPLTNIGLATKLVSKAKTASSQERFLGIIQNESAKLKQQIERFLQLMQLENGSFQLQKERLNLNDLLQEIVTDMQWQMTGQNGHLELHNETKDIYIEADKFHLSNAFRNLIDNAIKYAIEQPEIDIYLKNDDKNVHILFQDGGVGIPLNEQKQVFKKFHRVHTGNLHQQKGFGLGLAYVKTIIEAHKGVIEVFSEINKGSRFALHLPLKSIS